MSRHGVLSAAGILTIDPEHNRWVALPAETPSTLSGLFTLGLAHGLTHLWVMADTGILPDSAFYEEAQAEWKTVCTWRYHQNRPLPTSMINQLIQATGQSKMLSPNRNHNPYVSIIWPQNSHWDFGRDPALTPKELLRIIGYLEQALGVTVGSGPSTVGTRVLEKVLAPAYSHWLQVPERDLHTLPFTTQAAKNVIWDKPRELLDPELEKPYLVKIDKNSAYPRACVEELFGDSTFPEHVEGSRYADRYPGVWRITTQGTDRPDLPEPLWKDASWVGTPIVKLLHKMGYQVEVHEGWAWCEETRADGKIIKHYHGILKRWAEFLWEARKQFSDETRWKSPYARAAAQSAIKNVLNMTIGITSFDGYETPTYQNRPDWNVHVVASARAAMFYNVLKFEQEGHGTPVMVYIDALIYASDTPKPFADNRTSLGGYKHEWTLPLNDEVKAILTSQRSRAKKLEKLNDQAEELHKGEVGP